MSTSSTSIEWTDRTWGPTRGCSRVSVSVEHEETCWLSVPREERTWNACTCKKVGDQATATGSVVDPAVANIQHQEGGLRVAEGASVGTEQDCAREPWIVIRNIPGGYELSCSRCGDKYEPRIPCEMAVFVAICKSYGAQHARCRVISEPLRIGPGGQ